MFPKYMSVQVYLVKKNITLELQEKKTVYILKADKISDMYVGPYT